LLPTQQEANEIMDAAITPLELKQRLAAFPPPTLVDVRRQPAFLQDSQVIPGAIRRLPEAVDAWAATSSRGSPVVVYCVRGHEVSQDACAALRTRGLDCALRGGRPRELARRGQCLATVRRAHALGHARATEDRSHRLSLAHQALHRSVGGILLRAERRGAHVAAANGAVAYDIPDVDYSHVGVECSFDAFIRRHELSHPALDALANIVRAADTSTLDRSPQAPGLLARRSGCPRCSPTIMRC
jgi:rhodanese-related sulfurtransferase